MQDRDVPFIQAIPPPASQSDRTGTINIADIGPAKIARILPITTSIKKKTLCHLLKPEVVLHDLIPPMNSADHR